MEAPRHIFLSLLTEDEVEAALRLLGFQSLSSRIAPTRLHSTSLHLTVAADSRKLYKVRLYQIDGQTCLSELRRTVNQIFNSDTYHTNALESEGTLSSFSSSLFCEKKHQAIESCVFSS